MLKKTSDSSFWEDPISAKQINKQIADNNYKIDKINTYNKTLNDIEQSLQFLKEESDDEIFQDCDLKLSNLENDYNKFEKELFFNGKYDSLDAILEFKPGAGGTEAHDWASMLLRMYQRWAEENNYKFKLIDYLQGNEAGISSATVLISGKNAYGNLKGESGVHRLVRISPFDASKSRHTSFASVSVTPSIKDEITININPTDLRVDTYHSQGAGGQNVNKTESAVRVTHIPTGIVVSCQIHKDQLANKEFCMEMLKGKLIQLEEKKRSDELNNISGEKKEIAFSSQIRSYVFCPYTLVKDHRTDYSESNVTSIMDGNINGFIDSYLKWLFEKNNRS